MIFRRTEILEELFRQALPLYSEDDCAENIIIPLLRRLGFRNFSRKVTITGPTGVKFRKQADIVVYENGEPGIVVEAKKVQHRLREEDANQVLSYAHLVEPSAPYAVLTNGRNWEVYDLIQDRVGDIESVPAPNEVRAAVGRLRRAPFAEEGRRAAERLLVTLEAKGELETAFRNCRKVLAGEGLLAETAFDELTKILVCKFNEEKRQVEGLGVNRFTYPWVQTEGPLAAMREMFEDAKRRFGVFAPGSEVLVTKNSTVLELVRLLEPYGLYGFRSPLGLAGAGGDVVGSVYEAFLTGTLRGELGQYLTPRQLVDFMVELADLQIGERVLDLACGSGGFLTRAFLDLRKKISRLDTDESKKRGLLEDVIMNCLWGIEINPRLATLSRINLILHGDGFEHLYRGDSITDRVFTNTEGRSADLRRIEQGELPKFDVILMNPPFNLPVAEQGVLNWYELGRGKAWQGSDYLMLERAVRLLDPEKGRLLIIMPHGVASGPADREARDFIKRSCDIRAVISLPVGAFKPFGGSNARTCVLFLKARRDGGRRFLAQADAIGYDVTTKYYREMEDDDLLAIADAYWEFAGGGEG